MCENKLIECVKYLIRNLHGSIVAETIKIPQLYIMLLKTT